MSEVIRLFVDAVVLMTIWMTILWLLHFPLKNAAIVDVGWSAGLVLLACLYATLAHGDIHRRLLIAGMVSGWGLRLAGHLLLDRIIGKPEDARYVELRRRWAPGIGWKFFLFFQFQGLLNVFLSLPFLLICRNTAPYLTTTEWIAIAIWVIAIGGEALSDLQLRRFKASVLNHGRTCRNGLWRYSRHPNYFFEWMVWVSYFVAGLSSKGGWVGILSPIAMLFFLLRVTGIPMTEEQALKSRGDDYRRYQRTTSPFIPWFPKEEVAS